MTKTVGTLTVFCDGPDCTKAWDFEHLEYDDGSHTWSQVDYASSYFVGPDGHGLSDTTTIADVGGLAAYEASRQKYNLRHCGVDLKANPETLELILDRLALGSVSRVSLSGLASIVSS